MVADLHPEVVRLYLLSAEAEGEAEVEGVHESPKPKCLKSPK